MNDDGRLRAGHGVAAVATVVVAVDALMAVIVKGVVAIALRVGAFDDARWRA